MSASLTWPPPSRAMSASAPSLTFIRLRRLGRTSLWVTHPSYQNRPPTVTPAPLLESADAAVRPAAAGFVAAGGVSEALYVSISLCRSEEERGSAVNARPATAIKAEPRSAMPTPVAAWPLFQSERLKDG